MLSRRAEDNLRRPECHAKEKGVLSSASEQGKHVDVISYKLPTINLYSEKRQLTKL